jgi:hypothetical protein
MALAMHARWSAAWAGVMQSRAASAMAVRINFSLLTQTSAGTILL